MSGTGDRLLSINDRTSDLGTVTSVFGFRRTQMPIYLVSPEDDNFDISEDILSAPLVEFKESVLNPNGNWDEHSLKLQIGSISDDIKAITGRQIALSTSDKEHAEIRDETLDLFFSDFARVKNTIHNATTETEYKIDETQQTELILEILKYTGVIIRDPQIIQAAQQELVQDEANSKR